ncbi:nickel pincer cofactor biosynthesis protein LarC [Aquihabitans sp. G128]|uniref:nickel pincer cofactor biosynthesis protein LarC n=1 Tax=Aquihabitans sp. G128 TaxID=2849779 RepID=UPI001C238BCE|nr:nickel pincer cofactor biosynthesis protein LarC [Aquihabitans sp. G128]QXC59688.1 nickel pincer cofactor biosynthesis protein LarC [Aquihabitans sp. G128]
MTTAWFHCFSGVAGDMALGALVDAGADFDEVLRMLEHLPVGGWAAEAEPVLRGGIAGTKVHVRARESSVVRTASHIQGLVTEARLPPRVEQRAHAVFEALAVAEGRLHRRPPDQVHFHEVGGIDAIVDVVGTCAALELLGVDTVTCSPIAVGLGMVRAAHGIIPNPAPAVVELLQGIPTRGLDLSLELTTPTGAALMAGLATAFGPLPAMTVAASGFGAGSRELEGRPNLTQVVVGEPAAGEPVTGQPVLLLEANVDDVTGEVLAHAVGALLEAGAHDAWITPIVMKKGRPAHTVHALCDPVLGRQVSAVLAAETGTLGVRGQRIERWPAARSLDRVVVDDLSVRVKVSPGRVKAEFDDAAKVADRTGRPVREVLAEAEARWHAEQPAEPVEDGPTTLGPVPGHPGAHGWAPGAPASATDAIAAPWTGDEPFSEADAGSGGSVTPIHGHDHRHDEGHPSTHGHEHDHSHDHPHDHEPSGPEPVD